MAEEFEQVREASRSFWLTLVDVVFHLLPDKLGDWLAKDRPDEHGY
jgi:hypothetical protein